MNRFVFKIFGCFLFFSAILRSEITLDATRVSYDSANGIILASGDVHVIQALGKDKSRELWAEKIEYNKKTGDIKLIGESIMKESNGDIFSAKNIILKKDFKNAIAEAMVVVLNDSSKIKARKGNKADNLYTFENVSYSPCKETGCKLPLWDLVADKAVYDKKEKKITYKNVRLRIKGAPVFFSPYFEHPSFEVKRKTGFLMPIIRNMSDIGFLAGFPFYTAIAPDKSLKVTPFLNSKKRFLGAIEYKQLFHNADFSFSSSFLSKGKKIKKPLETATDEQKKKTEAKMRSEKKRWHIDTTLKSHDFDNKRISIRYNRSSDMTYRSKYPFVHRTDHGAYISKKFNDSNIIMDFYDKNYFLTAETHVYQTDDKKTAPAVYPHINLNARKEALFGEMTFDSDTLYLTRDEKKSEMFAEKFFRSSNKLSWQKSVNCVPFLVDVNSGLRADVFDTGKSEEAKETDPKLFPVFENQIGASLPFESKFGNKNHKSIWGPKMIFTSVQSSTKRAKIKQREDSIFDNFSDLNLHAINRFGGYDLIERGERISVGVENSIYNSKRRWLNFFVGRSHAISEDDDSQFKGRDAIVGRFVLKPLENLSFRTRFVGMPIFENSQQFESGVSGEYKRFFAGTSYLYDRRIKLIQEKGIAQVKINCGYKLNDFWKISASKIINVKGGGKKNLAHAAFASYVDECFEMEFGIYRTNFKDKDIKPRTGIILAISFKNLGNFIKSGRSHRYNDHFGMVE